MLKIARQPSVDRRLFDAGRSLIARGTDTTGAAMRYLRDPARGGHRRRAVLRSKGFRSGRRRHLDAGKWRVAAGAATAGAAVMFLLDPAQGRRRRAVLRDKTRSYANEIAKAAGTTGRDLANRIRGVVAKIRRLSRQEITSPELEERVRADAENYVGLQGEHEEIERRFNQLTAAYFVKNPIPTNQH